jgi:hypothetical protein
MRVADLMPQRDERPPNKKAAPAGRPASGGKAPTVYPTCDAAVKALERRHGPRSHLAVYRDDTGQPVGAVVRWNLANGEKDVRPVSKTPAGWTISAMPSPRPVYHLPDLLARPGETVYWVEGEPKADLLAGLGYLVVTSAGGAQAAAKSDFGPTAGRDIIMVPDRDPAGEEYAADVVNIAGKQTPPAKVRILRLASTWTWLPKGGDIADVIGSGEDHDTIKTKLALAAAAAGVVTVTEPEPEPTSVPVLVRMSDVEPRPVAWQWLGRIPQGRITLVVGRPGEGKSYFTIDATARITTGRPWPDGSPCPAGSVILISAEDDPHDTIRPRLDAHHADVAKVHLLSTVRRTIKGEAPHEVMFTLADVEALEVALRQTPDCRLIVVDPIGSFLGGSTDAHRDNEVRAVLAPVARLAEKYGVAVLVVAHRRKGAGSIADDLALGSRAFTGIARAVWHVSRDPDNRSRRLLLPGKNNLAPEGDGLAFSIVGPGNKAAVEWEEGPVRMSADDALAVENGEGGNGHRPGPDPEARSRAAEWLGELLKPGPLAVAKIKEEAEAAGYAWRTLHRSKDELGIRPYRDQFGGAWTWRLPNAPPPTCQPPRETENLASWHDRQKPKENGDSEPGTIAGCQDDLSWHVGSQPAPEGRQKGRV